jgi:hypothetical protein
MNGLHSAREEVHPEEKQRLLSDRNCHLLTATCVDLGTYTAIHSLRGWCEQQWSQVHGQTKLRTEGNCPPRHARIQARRAQSRQRTTRQGEEPEAGDRDRFARGRRLQSGKPIREQAQSRENQTPRAFRQDGGNPQIVTPEIFVGSQDVRSQNVRSQDLRSQDLRSQDVRSQEHWAQGDCSQDFIAQHDPQNGGTEINLAKINVAQIERAQIDGGAEYRNEAAYRIAEHSAHDAA